MNYVIFFLLAFFSMLLIYSNNKKGGKLSSAFPILTACSAIYTFIGSSIFNFAEKIPFDFLTQSSVGNREMAVFYFLLCSIVFSLGEFFVNKIYGDKKISWGQDKNYMIILRDKVGRIPNYYFFIITCLWPLLYIPSYGLANLLDRNIYRPEVNARNVLIVSNILFPISVISLGLVKNLWVRYTFLLLFLSINILSSSRIVAVTILLYLLGSSIRKGKFSIWKTLLLILLSAWMSAFTLYIRNSPVQGIQNILQLLTWFQIDTVIYTINYFTSFSIGVLSYAMDFPIENGKSIILYSLNPLPSFIYAGNVYERNLIGAAPYSSISMLYNELAFFGLIYFFSAGLLFRICESYSFRNNNFVQWIFCGCLSIIFSFISVQYTLRATTRIIYYLIFAMFVIFILKFIRRLLINATR